MEKIIARAKEVLKETRSTVDTRKKTMQNRINKLELRRENLEEDRADRLIEQDAFKRLYSKANGEIKQLRIQMNELDDDREKNIDTFSNLMALTEDLKKTYLNADTNLKRHLITLFFDKIIIKDRKISNVEYTKAVAVLKENRSVIITNVWLPGSDSNRRPIR